jgi:hypothetical protein
MNRYHYFLMLATTAGLCASLACKSQASSSAAATNAAVAAPAAQAPGKARPSRIIFVGKEHACDCTKKSVEAGWAALQKALGTPANLPVERLQMDTQGDKVAPYRQQKTMVALPALYFVDGKNSVLGLLQGEVTAEQISEAITTGKTP